MVCRLCLENSSEVLEMFNNKGQELKIAMVIGKHFWFEPNNEDPVSSNICHHCWKKLSEFHEFYKHVENAQQLLTVEVIVKTEDNFPFLDTTVEDIELPCKRELDTIEELYEEPLNVPSDVLADGNYDIIEYEFGNNKKENDDQDTLNINDEIEDESVVEFNINEKTKIMRKNRTKLKRSCKRNKVNLSLSDEDKTLPTYKERGRHRKGEGVPLENESNSNQEKPAKGTDESVSNGTTQEMSEMINREISEYMQLKCDVCGLDLETFAHIRNHMRTVHKVQPYVKCCEKKFSKRALLYDHIKFHLNPEIYKCEKCDKTFSDNCTFKYHNNAKHQSEDDKIFQCPQCPKKFAKKYLLQTHKNRHNNELKYFCPECNKGFSYMSALSSHTALMHSDYGTMCDICSKIVKGPAAFKRHQLEHQGIVEPKVQCDLCGSWHKDKLSLAKHKRRHRYREQPQVCNVCQKTYASREALYRHKRHVHESDGKYECNICQKSFKMANSLKEHMSQHTGLSLYRCPHCSRTFNNNSNMHKHRKHMHPKEFEEFRRLRKISARSKEPILPTISSLSDATKASGEFHPFSSGVLDMIKEKEEQAEYELDTLR